MRVISIKFKKIKEQLTLCLLCFVILGGVFYKYGQNDTVSVMQAMYEKTIVIDAGHGGWDPGKPGTHGDDEKNINLKIALLLQQYLEQSGATVLITRLSDEALGDGKQADMKSRKGIVNESDGDIFISIHQNAFPKSSAHGAQVFYHSSSKKGELLAKHIQNTLKETLDPTNTRQAKQNSDYYVLKNTTIPSAIVECGFLSNPSEEALLNQEEYQEKIAWAIYLGIIEYFDDELSL